MEKTSKFKFNIGDLVKHKAANPMMPTVYIIIGRGLMEYRKHKQNLYLLFSESHKGYEYENELEKLTNEELRKRKSVVSACLTRMFSYSQSVKRKSQSPGR